ncbi:MAG TPA: hypothetical protein VFS67_29735 [Polyangiaceae bacterium]|nr:hypothetical protein [Polyangiaceae bacterium]
MPLSLIPFAGGLQGGIDPRLLPDGALSDAVNCELDRQGRLVGRAGFTAAGTGVLSTGAGALVAYDVVHYQGRLFALGDDTRLSVPANLYEYLGSGVASPWRPTSPVLGKEPRLPQATRVRDICRPPDQPSGVTHMHGAALGGFAALVWNNADDETASTLMVVRAADDQAVLIASLSTSSDRPCQSVRLVALSDRFMIVGINASTNNVSIASFTPASDTAVTQLVQNVFTFGANVLRIATCKVSGSDEFMVLASDLASTVQLKRFSNAGVDSGVTYTVSASGTYTFLAVEASATANQITIALVKSGSNPVEIYSYNLTTGAEIGTGPHSPFSTDAADQVALVRESSTQLQVLATLTGGTEDVIKANRYTVSTNTFAGAIAAMTDAVLATDALVTGWGEMFGVRIGDGSVANTPNCLVSWALTSTGMRFEISKDLETAGTMSLVTALVQDSSTGKYYWCNAAANPDGSLLPMLTEFEFGSTDRRQAAEFGGHLYLGGGAISVFDGISLAESGFQERPRIISLTASNGAGSLTNSGEYDYRVHWEWIDSKGELHLSAPSVIETVTLGASDDTVTAVVSSPHSLRRSTGKVDGTSVACVLSRTLYSGGTKGENFQRAAVEYVGLSDDVAEYVTIVDIRKDQSSPIVDSDLIRQQVLYSQGVASGAHHAPPPGDYLAAGRERLHVSGQPKRNRSTASKLLVAGEPAEFAFEGFLQFQSLLGEDILATHVLGDSVLHWTRGSIWEVTGSGPARNGQGEFFAARRVANSTGLIDEDGWRSLCETDRGIFFQESATRLVELTKAGTVQWTGRPVQEYLELYPVVTAAVQVPARHSVAFAVTNAAGNAGGILRYDLENDAWFFDDVGAVQSLCEYQGRLVYLQGGVVYLENATRGTGTFVGYSVSTGMFQGFQALGWGQVNEVGFLGTFRGNCTVTITASANGTSFSETLASWSLSSSEYSVGQRVTLLKAPAVQMRDSFALRYAVTGTSDSEGVWLHAAALDTDRAPHFSRQGAAHRA